MYSDGAIKRMEDGSIGELRTRELLIDRYWLLERYIDFEGADTLIQRKLSYFGSISPTRLGIAQSKFRIDITQEIKINELFVLDEDESIRDEFFLFVHTGFEEKKRTFFLTANQIVEDFNLKEGFFHVVVTDEYEVFRSDIKKTLDEIEQKLESVDFLRNRSFVTDYFTGINKVEDILEDYTLHLTEKDQDILEFNRTIKSYASDCLNEIYMQVSEINEIMHENDPMILYKKAESFLKHDIQDSHFFNMDEVTKEFVSNVNSLLYDQSYKQQIESDIKEYEDLSLVLKSNEKFFIRYVQNEIYKEISSFKRKRAGKVHSTIRIPFRTHEKLLATRNSIFDKKEVLVVNATPEYVFVHFSWDYDPELDSYEIIQKAYFLNIHPITNEIIQLINKKIIKIKICECN
ncbi:hypothetical protein PDR89_16140 [Bacillus cereus group sp. Bc002]|uniref:hypothetical protein n=1 Tax=Bacillus cereus group TaxID=86661 RepID=UPI0022DFEC0D|nr:hypothetical protein [Bacillus cereus group sp. Bc002]MDA2780970.1 hypothetical protein [Bacillus cereus group sp. Bc002]